ncbi:MAG TPA: hypothetical protein VI258_08840, partial [Rhodanobacteraceae bacterium]
IVTARPLGRSIFHDMNENWQQTVRQKSGGGGLMATLVQILTLGIAEKPEQWEVEYKNRTTGAIVRGVGPSLSAAENDATSRIV